MKEGNDFNFVLKIIDYASDNLDKILCTSNDYLCIRVSDNLKVSIQKVFYNNFCEVGFNINNEGYTVKSLEFKEKDLSLLKYKLASLHETFMSLITNEVLDIISNKNYEKSIKNTDDLFDNDN